MKLTELRPDTVYARLVRDAASGDHLHPMLLCDGGSGTIDSRLFELTQMGYDFRVNTEARRPNLGDGIGYLAAVHHHGLLRTYLTDPRRRTRADSAARALAGKSPAVVDDEVSEICPVPGSGWELITPSQILCAWDDLPPLRGQENPAAPPNQPAADRDDAKIRKLESESRARRRRAAAADPELADLVRRLCALGVDAVLDLSSSGTQPRVSIHARGKALQPLQEVLRGGLKTAEGIVSGPEASAALRAIAEVKAAVEAEGSGRSAHDVAIEIFEEWRQADQASGGPVEIEDLGTPPFTAPGPVVDAVLETLGEACAGASMPTTYEGLNPEADRYLMAGILAELRRMNDLAEGGAR